MRVIGYCRVSKADGDGQGQSLRAQEEVIRREAERRGWTVVRIIHDNGHSGATIKRPGIREALALLNSHEADALVVARLDRFGRNLGALTDVLEASHREQWCLVALDTGVDSSTSHGRLMLSIMMALAQWEREQTSDRTRAVLAAMKRRGERVGPPSKTLPATSARIRRMRGKGMKLQEIADRLNAEGVEGRTWYPASVSRAIPRRSTVKAAS